MDPGMSKFQSNLINSMEYDEQLNERNEEGSQNSGSEVMHITGRMDRYIARPHPARGFRKWIIRRQVSI